MSTKSGFQSTIIPLVIGAQASGLAAPYTNGGLSIGTLKAGRYLVIFNTSIDPINVGATITNTQMLLTGNAVFGAVGAFGIVQNQVTATVPTADANSRHSCSNIVDLPNDTPLFVSIAATTSVGQWQSSTSVQDLLCTRVCAIKLQ